MNINQTLLHRKSFFRHIANNIKIVTLKPSTIFKKDKTIYQTMKINYGDSKTLVKQKLSLEKITRGNVLPKTLIQRDVNYDKTKNRNMVYIKEM